jgi:hypothetical protein
VKEFNQVIDYVCGSDVKEYDKEDLIDFVDADGN